MPELGFAFVGPADLSVSLGRHFEKDHPDVQSAVGEVRDARLGADVPLGWVTDDTSDADSQSNAATTCSASDTR